MRIFTRFLVFCFLLLSLSSCGGGGGSSTSDDSPEKLTLGRDVVDVTVELPGVAGDFTVLSSLGAGDLSGGVFGLPVYGEGGQLAVVVSGNGAPMLLGWPTPSNSVINANTTAQVLVYFALMGYAMPQEAQLAMIAALPDQVELDPLADAILLALQGDPDAFLTENATVAAALADAVVALENSFNAEAFAKVLVNPDEDKSGLELNTTGVNSIYFRNKYRRTSEVFIDRTSTFDEEGVETPSPARLTRYGIPATQALGGATSTFIDIAYGRMAMQEFDTDPVELPTVPDTAKTRYRVCVVGPGANTGDLSQLSAEELAAQQSVTRDFVVRELFLPMVLNLLIPNSSLDDAMNLIGGGDIVADFISITGQTLPGIWEKAYSGDIQGTAVDFYNAFASNSTYRNALCQLILNMIEDSEGRAVAEAAANNATALLNALKVVDVFLSSFDVIGVGYSLNNSKMADIWTVDVQEPVIKLLPAESSLGNSEEVDLSVSAPELSDSGLNLVYEWSNTATYGHISDNLQSVQDNFTATNSKVTYTANSSGEGTDTVTVNVYYTSGPSGAGRTLIGTATATVEVRETSTYTLAGNTGTFDMQFVVDDNLDVYLNGNLIYTTGTGYSGGHYSFDFSAAQGDTLRFVVRDTWGSCASLSPLILRKGAETTTISNGFSLGCGRPGGDQGVVFDQSAVIPF